jgi:hypothetical protein
MLGQNYENHDKTERNRPVGSQFRSRGGDKQCHRHAGTPKIKPNAGYLSAS